VGIVTSEHLDKFLIKLQLVRREHPDTQGTIVSTSSFTDGVRSHATAVGIQLTLYRDLSAQILDAPSYAQALIREAKVNDRYCPDLFVDPVIGYNPSDEGKNAFEFLDQWLKDGHWNQLTLLGDVGTGKSFLSRMLALRLATEYLKNPTEAPLPLLVDLRNADREFSLEGLILTHFAKYGLSRATFEIFQFLLSEGRIVLILDGFDEMASRVTPQITTRNFHELARCVKRNAKVLLTCRTHYFKSRTEEEEVVLGGTGPQSSDVARDLYWDLISRSGFKIAYLRPFTISQVEEYVRKARPQNATTILAKIHNIYNLSELSQRPLLLEMIVKSIDRLTESEVNPAHLYEVFTGAWTHRDRWRDLLRPEDKLKFLTALARSLWEQEKTSIDYRTLEAYVSAELASLIDSPQKLVELDGEIRTASFLVRDDQEQYGFAHSSYAEYFLARDLANHIAVGNVRVFAIRRLTNEIIDFLLWMVDKNALEEMLTVVLLQEYQPLLSENALVVLYRLRRSLLVEEKGRGRVGESLRIDMPTGAKLQGAKLAQINLEGAILKATRLDGADLEQCIAIDVDLTSASLRGASFRKGDLQGARLRDVDATGAALREVNFHGADVAGCDFSRADLSGSIFTVKDYTGAVFKDAVVDSAVLPANSESTILGREVQTPAASAEWDIEQSLRQVFEEVWRYAKKQGAGSDSGDVASDVVVYLLSNPSEMVRLKALGGKVEEISRTLAWRRLSTLRRVQNVRLGPTSPEDQRMAAAEDNDHDLSVLQSDLEGYSFDLETPNELSDIDQESTESDLDSDDYDLGTIPESQVPSEEMISLREEPNETRPEANDLMNVLGKSLSEEALQMLIARYVEDESVEEIAKKLGISDVQVVRQLNMARELARKALRPS
jgi:DNA-directed RNA polymerase specialized sigma24 family protein